ncbi:MAG: hypothetical protein GZ091_17585 [Paludibacter sp.]|nr:hypothetical protein [Paludibacter sp.]
MKTSSIINNLFALTALKTLTANHLHFKMKIRNQLQNFQIVVGGVHSKTRQRILLYTMSIIAFLILPGCGTIANSFSGAKSPIYLHISEYNLSHTKFLLDGKPVNWYMTEYSRTLASENYNSKTFEINSIPAIEAKSNQKYYTLTLLNASFTRKDILIKRNISSNANLYLALDTYFSAGVGTMIDIFDNSLLKLPSLNLNNVEMIRTPYLFVNTEDVFDANYIKTK